MAPTRTHHRRRLPLGGFEAGSFGCHGGLNWLPTCEFYELVECALGNDATAAGCLAYLNGGNGGASVERLASRVVGLRGLFHASCLPDVVIRQRFAVLQKLPREEERTTLERCVVLDNFLPQVINRFGVVAHFQNEFDVALSNADLHVDVDVRQRGGN